MTYNKDPPKGKYTALEKGKGKAEERSNRGDDDGHVGPDDSGQSRRRQQEAEYIMKNFKVYFCRKRHAHITGNCINTHTGDVIRRNPRFCNHSHQVCEHTKHSLNGKCSLGDSCPLSHGMYEHYFRSNVYKTEPCLKETKCSWRYCQFYHNEEERREVLCEKHKFPLSVESAPKCTGPFVDNEYNQVNEEPLRKLQNPNVDSPPIFHTANPSFLSRKNTRKQERKHICCNFQDLIEEGSGEEDDDVRSRDLIPHAYEDFSIAPVQACEHMEITQILLGAQSPDAAVRSEAEKQLALFREQNLPGYLLSLSTELANDSKPVDTRRLAGIVLKNALDAKEVATREQLFQQWVSIDSSMKSQIKSLLLNTLGSATREANHTAAQVIAKTAAIEIPRKEWPELIQALLVNMTQQDKPPSLRQATLETLGYVCEEISHHDLVKDEVNAILTAVVQGMNATEHNHAVRLAATRALYNAIDFWSSTCDEEIELQDYEVPDSTDSSVPHSCFIVKALPTLVPMLLETLLKQDEDQDQDDGIWNLAMAGGTCLGLVARTVGDAIVPLVMPFFLSNISKEEWRPREAATLAFGSILDGPSIQILSPMVQNGLNFLLDAMKYQDSHVKDTTAWTLSRIFELLHSSGFSVVTPANLQQIVMVLIEGLKDAPHVAEKVCGAIYYLAQGFEDTEPSSAMLTPYLPDIIGSLIVAADRTDSGDSKLRTSAYETLNEVIRCCNFPETSQIMPQLLPAIMKSASKMVAQTDPNDDEMVNYGNQLRRSIFEAYSGLLHGFKETKADLMLPHAQHLLQFIEIVSSDPQRDESVTKAAVAVLGDLADAMGPNIKMMFKDPAVFSELLRECRESHDEQLKETASWAQGMLARVFADRG